MERRSLGHLDAQVTEISFGTAALGNMFEVVADADARESIQTAWELGVRCFDTAPHYGLGLSEYRLGDALSDFSRSDYMLSSKIGRRLVRNPHPSGSDPAGFLVPDDWVRSWDFSEAGVRSTVSGSLDRLQTDYLDIAFLHDPELGPEGSLDSGVASLESLKAEGVVRWIGVGTNDSASAIAALEHPGVDVTMIAGRASLIDHDGFDGILEAADGKGIMVAGVFNSGLLAEDRPKADARFDYDMASPDLMQAALELADVCTSHGSSLPAAAINFPLRYSAVSSVVMGARSAAEVRRNVELYERGVPTALWSAFDRWASARTIDRTRGYSSTD